MRMKKTYTVDFSLQDVLNEFTPFTVDLIAQDILRLSSMSVANDSTTICTVKDRGKQFTVDRAMVICTCPFNRGYRLPCRHILHVIQSLGFEDSMFISVLICLNL